MLSSTGTIQELYDPALEVTTQQQADEYLAALVARQKKLFKLGETAAVEREKRSISFWASFEDPETFAFGVYARGKAMKTKGQIIMLRASKHRLFNLVPPGSMFPEEPETLLFTVAAFPYCYHATIEWRQDRLGSFVCSINRDGEPLTAELTQRNFENVCCAIQEVLTSVYELNEIPKFRPSTVGALK